MAVVQTGAWWKQQEQLMERVAEAHGAGEVTDAGAVRLFAQITEGAYKAGVEHLVATGVIPRSDLAQP